MGPGHGQLEYGSLKLQHAIVGGIVMLVENPCLRERSPQFARLSAPLEAALRCSPRLRPDRARHGRHRPAARCVHPACAPLQTLALRCSSFSHATRRLTMSGTGSFSRLRAVWFQKWLRIHMERDPIVLFSCTIGMIGALPLAAQPACRPPLAALLSHAAFPRSSSGLVVPWIVGDGGRRKEDAATSYAYRVKHVYPPSS